MSNRYWRGLTTCFLSLFLGLLLCLLAAAPACAEGAIDPKGSATYPSENVLDWNQFSFSSLPPLQESGGFSLDRALAQQLGYDASRSWQAGSRLDSVLRLGDVQDTFGLQQLSLNQIVQITHLDLNRLGLEQFGLLQNQTIASLVNAIPNLGQFSLSQVKPLATLISQATGTLTSSNQTLQTIASNTQYIRPLVNNLGLSKYSVT